MFIPQRVVFEEKALNFQLGKELFERFNNQGITVEVNKTGRVNGPKDDDVKRYFDGKRTLVVGVKGKTKFQSCKPSAHYQLPLVSGCMGMCEYCYLNTQLGKRPYIKIYVDIEDILSRAFEYANERLPYITIFEGSATSDPIPVEVYTHGLSKAIEAFGKNDNTAFRFVSKYSEVEPFIGLQHNNHTTIRFSINSQEIVKKYEHRTDSADKRIEAAKRVRNDGYDVGFIIAPVFLYDTWKEDYSKLLDKIESEFKGEDIKFEVISHRFTERAKNNILEIYKNSTLPMDKEMRKFKYGQFGYGKYIYKDEEIKLIKDFFAERIKSSFGDDSILYII